MAGTVNQYQAHRTLRKSYNCQPQVLVITFMLIQFSLWSQNTDKDSILLFFLGGQSNMEGHGNVADLPDSLNTDFNDVWIFQGNPRPDEDSSGGLGIWANLTPGHGAGFSSDGKANYLSPQKFGLELSFAKTIQRLYPGQKIALIKYSRGGSSIDSLAARDYGSWEIDYRGRNGINQFDHFLTTINQAFSTQDINKDGKSDELIPCGIIWMQGESDAVISEEIANRYFSNLKRLMDLIRASFRKDDLAVVIGKISDSGQNSTGKVWPYGEIVQEAQERYVKGDKHAAIVRDTQLYGYSDPYHYDSEGYIRLGKRFAQVVHCINKVPSNHEP